LLKDATEECMVTADDKVCEHYFNKLEMKQSIVNNAIDQWHQGATLWKFAYSCW